MGELNMDNNDQNPQTPPTSPINDKDHGQYSIQLASKISGVGVHTIRAWEKRYGAVKPGRNESGRREYSDRDIERLTLLNDLCTLGHTIGKIAQLPTAELEQLLAKLGKQQNTGYSAETVQAVTHQVVDIPNSLRSLLMALSIYKLDVINHEINKLKLILSPRELALEIIGPLLNEVAWAVDRGEFNISQEHALSAILKFHMGHVLFRNSVKSPGPQKILMTTPESDYHEFGIIQAALLCQHYQINFFYLGPNMPAEALVDAYNGLDCTSILLGSAVVPEGQTAHQVNQYFEKIVKGIEGRGKLLVGGGSHVDRTRLEVGDTAIFFPDVPALDKYLKAL